MNKSTRILLAILSSIVCSAGLWLVVFMANMSYEKLQLFAWLVSASLSCALSVMVYKIDE